MLRECGFAVLSHSVLQSKALGGGGMKVKKVILPSDFFEEAGVELEFKCSPKILQRGPDE